MNTNWQKIFFAALLSTTVATQHARADDIEYSNATKNVATARLLPKEVPPTLTFKELDASWQYVTLNETKPKSDGAPSKVPASIPEAIDRALKAAPNVYLTQWQTANSGNQSFLIAYQVVPFITSEKFRVYLSDSPPLTARFALRSEYLDFLKTEADTRPLELTLLNLQTIGVANAIKPYNAKQRDDDLLSYIVLSGFRETPNKFDFQSMQHLSSLGMALNQYAQEYDEKLPPMQNIAAFKKEIFIYIKDESFFVQPSNGKPYVTNSKLMGKTLKDIADPANMVALYEAQPGIDNKRAVVFMDMHVKRVTAAQWAKIKKDSGIN